MQPINKDLMTEIAILSGEEARAMVAEFQDQLDWMQMERDEWEINYHNMESKNSLLQAHLDKLLNEDPLGMQLSAALAENDRLKDKCNVLNKLLTARGIKV